MERGWVVLAGSIHGTEVSLWENPGGGGRLFPSCSSGRRTFIKGQVLVVCNKYLILQQGDGRKATRTQRHQSTSVHSARP